LLPSRLTSTLATALRSREPEGRRRGVRLIGVYHTGFTVRNLERSVAFYRDLLGMQLVAERVGDEPYLGAVTGFPGVRIKFAFLAVEGSDHLLELLSR
jgi:lactoylglutathione lyase